MKYEYKPKDNLTDMAIEARKMGMSYGQYCAYLASKSSGERRRDEKSEKKGGAERNGGQTK